MFEIFIMAVPVFAITNMDDFIALHFLFASNYRVSNIVLGQLMGIITLTTLSIIFAFISHKAGSSFSLSKEWTGLLGFMPIGVGVWSFFRKSEDEVSLEQKSGWRQIFAVAYLTMSGGGDNISVYTLFFLPLSWWQIMEVTVIFVVMTGVWCLLVYSLSKYFRFDRFAEQNSKYLPYLFICFGIYIFWSNDTIEWLSTFL